MQLSRGALCLCIVNDFYIVVYPSVFGVCLFLPDHFLPSPSPFPTSPSLPPLLFYPLSLPNWVIPPTIPSPFPLLCPLALSPPRQMQSTLNWQTTSSQYQEVPTITTTPTLISFLTLPRGYLSRQCGQGGAMPLRTPSCLSYSSSTTLSSWDHPLMRCGPSATKLLVLSWPRQLTSPHCHGVDKVSPSE